jgi:Flp pilus assembly protein TadG
MPSIIRSVMRAGQWRFGNFWRARAGAIALGFGLALIPLMIMGGVVIDYYNISRVRTAAQGAIDSAALSGSSTATQKLKAGGTAAAAKTAGDAAAAAAFAAAIANLPVAAGSSFSAGGTVNATTATYASTATLTVKTNIMKMVGFTSVSLHMSSTASASTGVKYIDVYVMVDISGSMMLGSTQADIDALNAKFGCALACHDGATNVWNGTSWGDAYQWAIKNGVTLRYQVLYDGVTNLVNYINSVDSNHTRVRLALYSFDQSLNKVVSLSSSLSNIANKYPAPAVDNSDTDGATLFNENIGTVISDIGAGGDGSSASHRAKLLILATDGVEDPGRQWTYNTWLQANVKGFDTTFCTTLKGNNVKIGIINTPYLPMTYDWGYNATLGQPGTIGATRVDDIAPNFQQCAGDLFVRSSDSTTIKNAFTAIFQSFNNLRLTH